MEKLDRGEIAQGHSILSEFEDKPRSAGCKAIVFPVQQAVLCSQDSMEGQRLSGGGGTEEMDRV